MFDTRIVFRRGACGLVVALALGHSATFAENLRIRVPTTPTVVAPIAPPVVAPVVSTVVRPTPTVTTPPPTTPLVTVTPTPVTGATPTTTTPTFSPTLSNPVSTPVQNVSQVLSSSANTTVNSSGTLVVSTPPSAPLVLSGSATHNAQIQIPVNQAVSITTGSATLSYLDKTGSSQLLVRNSDGAPKIEIGGGQVEIKSTAAGNVIPLASDSAGKVLAKLTTVTGSDTLTVIKDKDNTRLFVGSGKVQVDAPGQDAPVAVFKGETGKLDADGKLVQISLGSPDGAGQLPGDPLPKQSWHGVGTTIPRLDGKLARFDNQLSLLDIAQGAFSSLFGMNGGQITYDNITGTLTLTVGGTTINLIPVGSSNVVPYSYHSAQKASGAFDYASQGIQITLAATVGFFSDLIESIKYLDPAGQVTLKSNGVLEVKANGNRFAALPGATSTLPDNPVAKPGLEVGANGLVVFRDRRGALQTLYPSFADIDRLTSVAGEAAPGASLANNGNGNVVLNVSGKSYTLAPEYLVRDLPGSHAADKWWAGSNNQLFLSNGDNTAQGFLVK